MAKVMCRAVTLMLIFVLTACTPENMVWPETGGQALPSSWPEGTTALFVGNSLVEGIRQNADSQHTFWCRTGIMLPDLNSELVLPGKYDLAVIEMGTNELGGYSEEKFKNEYKKLIGMLDCPCYCLGIPPVNEDKSQYAERISNANVALYNGWIEDVCNATGAVYVDCSGFFGSVLDPSWTRDGLHMNGRVYAAWYEWILQQIGL